MFPSISRLFLRSMSAKVYSQTGWGRHSRKKPSGSTTVLITLQVALSKYGVYDYDYTFMMRRRQQTKDAGK